MKRYLVVRGESKTLVLYWYQTPKRIVASEYAAKFWLAADSVRYRRSDTSLVRVIVPVGAISLEEADRLADKLDATDRAMLARSVSTIVAQVQAMKQLVNEFRDYARLPAAAAALRHAGVLPARAR